MTTRKIIPARPCAVCGKDFVPPQRNFFCCAPKCSADYQRAKRRASEARRPHVIRDCLRCGKPMEVRSRKSGNKLYCSAECKLPPLAPVADGVPCRHCGRPFAKTGRRIYCSAECRVAHFKLLHDEGEEIPVVDIDEAPRRLAVAKLFDKFECNGAFDHFTPPQWINPADRRASR
ncbi:hypothetical protein IVB30_02095 [Bradyrhizobium sp. 200]|uniref:hypothetical protein n=1 Tax=Bradyrhizobium sp. 200 TaxID=2782665 RepID=UPI001FFFC383|nr:hypothetical protein [Bradyrhizobium sp. 200]UPJ50249.1 hypothetical protein IVB30_02095 [Bradyrhizobium sp. 200]